MGIDIRARIRLGQPAPLRVGERIRVVGPSRHRIQDRVRGAIQDSYQRVDAVRRQGLGQGFDNRDGAGHARLEPQRAQLCQRRPTRCDQLLVRGDHLEARLERAAYIGKGRVDSADQFDDRVQVRPLQQGIGRNKGSGCRPPFGTSDRDGIQDDRPARSGAH